MNPNRSNLITLGCLLFLIFALGWMFGPSGSVHGVEFSPDAFVHRSFTYFVWCGIPCTPTLRETWHSDLDTYLHQAGYVTPTKETRWWLVKGFAPGVRGWSGDAGYICKSFGCWSGESKWVKWSQQRPDLAKVLWPQSITMARNQEYTALFTLFRSGSLETAQTPREVQQLINESLLED